MAAGGTAPISTSRAMPPALPAVHDKTRTPNRSSRLLTPAVAPLSAKTKVPTRSSTSRSVSIAAFQSARASAQIHPHDSSGHEAPSQSASPAKAGAHGRSRSRHSPGKRGRVASLNHLNGLSTSAPHDVQEALHIHG